MCKDELLSNLSRIDKHVFLSFGDSERFRVIIVGGSALVLRGHLERSTADIDIIQADRRLYEIMSLYDANGRVGAYENNFPYNYEDRIEKIYSGVIIDFYTASLEDIVISKLYSFRDDDYADVCNMAEKINWDILAKLAFDEDEAKASALNEKNYQDFLVNYRRFEKEHR